jgi:hypothetical protein
MQNGFNREGEGGHDPREDVDGLTWKNHSQMNILEAFCNIFSHLRKGSKFTFISSSVLEYQVGPYTKY